MIPCPGAKVDSPAVSASARPSSRTPTPCPEVCQDTARVVLGMTTIVNTIVAYAIGIASLLGLGLMLAAGSVVLWEAMRRWRSAHMEARDQLSGRPMASRFE